MSRATRAPHPLDAFRVARGHFLRGEPLKMTSLAKEVGVDRATLYRWVGTRSQLYCKIAWHLIDRSVRGALQRTSSRSGPAKVGRALRQFVEDVQNSGTLPPLFDREGLGALLKLTSSEGWVRPRMVALFVQIIRDEVPQRWTEARLDLVADAMARLVESYLWIDLANTTTPRTSTLDQQIELLLQRGPDPDPLVNDHSEARGNADGASNGTPHDDAA